MHTYLEVLAIWYTNRSWVCSYNPLTLILCITIGTMHYTSPVLVRYNGCFVFCRRKIILIFVLSRVAYHMLLHYSFILYVLLTLTKIWIFLKIVIDISNMIVLSSLYKIRNFIDIQNIVIEIFSVFCQLWPEKYCYLKNVISYLICLMDVYCCTS